MKTKIISLILALSFGLTSCAKNLNSGTYVDSSTVGIVYEGVIISARPIMVKGSDKLGEKPGLGALGGGLAGGIGGSNIGKGKGSAAAAVGGAIAGAVVGAMVEDALNTQQGMEYIIKLSDDSLDDGKSTMQNKNYGNRSVEDKIRNSTKMSMKSKVISVVQGMDNPLSVGTHVYIIYNDDRPRVVPATY